MLILYFVLGGESRYFNFFSENRLTLGDFMGGGQLGYFNFSENIYLPAKTNINLSSKVQFAIQHSMW